MNTSVTSHGAVAHTKAFDPQGGTHVLRHWEGEGMIRDHHEMFINYITDNDNL